MLSPTLRIALLSIFTVSATAIPYSEYILTPSSRTILPQSIYNINGTVSNAEALTQPASSTNTNNTTTFSPTSAITYDFGKNIGGIVSFNTGLVTGNETIGISFTESSLWITPYSCDATSDAGVDLPLTFSVISDSFYAAEKQHQRGGFRYLNIYHDTGGTVELSNLTIQFTAVPQKSEDELQAYTGYFHSDDELINRVWYAGAYTNDMCTIDPTAGNSLIHLGEIANTSTVELVTWENADTIANGSSVLVDGAKRDRLVWPGDIAISGPSIFVSTNDMDTIKNSLDSLLLMQNASGALPYAGNPFYDEIGDTWSFTYHLYSLIDIYDYYLFTGNVSYLQLNWSKFKLGMNFSLSFVDDENLAYVPLNNGDWLRVGMGAHNIEANSILYYTLNLGTQLAQIMNDTSSETTSWATYAANIKEAANEKLWDDSANLYRDNDSLPLTTLHPQDGNSWAIVSGLVSNSSRTTLISDSLSARWGPYGAPAPEGGGTANQSVISPFVSGFEIQAHYIANRADRAVSLIKLMWGFMLDDERMTNSTFIEGYSSDGSLHYAPYRNDPRVSHAHGWSTGPTSALAFWGAGLRVTAAAGETWVVSPSLGGLGVVEAGFETGLGGFSVKAEGDGEGRLVGIKVCTPVGTIGEISVPYVINTTAVVSLMQENGTAIVREIGAGNATSGRYTIEGVEGGNWTVTITY